MELQVKAMLVQHLLLIKAGVVVDLLLPHLVSLVEQDLQLIQLGGMQVRLHKLAKAAMVIQVA
jgi:hypothetical protein